MPPTITRIDKPEWYAGQAMRVTKSNGDVVDIGLLHYIRFQKTNGETVYGKVYAFSISTDPKNSFGYLIGKSPEGYAITGPELTGDELDTIESLGTDNPNARRLINIGGRRKNRRGTK